LEQNWRSPLLLQLLPYTISTIGVGVGAKVEFGANFFNYLRTSVVDCLFILLTTNQVQLSHTISFHTSIGTRKLSTWSSAGDTWCRRSTNASSKVHSKYYNYTCMIINSM
jgi:hypothetical protein